MFSGEGSNSFVSYQLNAQDANGNIDAVLISYRYTPTGCYLIKLTRYLITLT